MNLDDESHLSAYLDDELDPADRLAVEWSVESSPPRADQLRAIASVRDAVAGLDRPMLPRDLAAAVTARLALNRRAVLRRWPLSLSLSRPARVASVAAAFAGFAAIAASLVFALIRLNALLHESPEQIAVVRQQAESSPSSRTHPVADIALASNPVPTPHLLDRLDQSSRSPQLIVSKAPEASGPPNPALVTEDRPGPDDRRKFGEMLSRPHLSRVLIVTDVIDALDRVRDIIAGHGRETPEFGRVSIRQEILLDPDHPQAAEVFAVPIDERGRDALVGRLRADFPELAEDGPASPDLVTQLTEAGQVAVLRGLKASPLGDPPGQIPEFIANRHKERPLSIFESDRVAAEASATNQAGSAQAERRDAPADGSLGIAFVGPLDVRRKSPPKPGDRVTLLVWVARRSAG